MQGLGAAAGTLDTFLCSQLCLSDGQVGTILKLFCQHIISGEDKGRSLIQLNFTHFIPSILTFTLKISNAHLSSVDDIDIIFGLTGGRRERDGSKNPKSKQK